MEATSNPRSRRALLAAAVGGFAAVVAQALGRPAPSRAAASYVVLGAYNSEATRTTIENLSTGTTVAATALRGTTNAAGGTAAGVEGLATDAIGVQGKSTNWIGVNGQSGAYIGVSGYGEWAGVVGQSTNGMAFYGSSPATGKAAVVGNAVWDNTGVQGFSGHTELAPTPPAETGVHGSCNLSPSARGVSGRSTIGRGVYGSTDSGSAGYFSARTGRGVYAVAGVAGTALEVSGVARFSRSGRLTIPAGGSSITKLGVPLGSDSLVLAVLQQDRPGVWVRSVVPDPAADQFTIRLNNLVLFATDVAWFVIG
ncbi:MAG: hypothetical protein A2X23_01405 [Chloroflexi bacterium GWC2_73_18]|nr:MAG: hypothetical protein A2X23_01405 [Chloroflexi bacterium GWC2_73_18]